MTSLGCQRRSDNVATYPKALPTRPTSQRAVSQRRLTHCSAMVHCWVDQLCSPACSRISYGREKCGRSWNLCRNLCNSVSRLAIILPAAWYFGCEWHSQLANEAAKLHSAKEFSAVLSVWSSVIVIVIVVVATQLEGLAMATLAYLRQLQSWWYFQGSMTVHQSLRLLRSPSPMQYLETNRRVPFWLRWRTFVS